MTIQPRATETDDPDKAAASQARVDAIVASLADLDEQPLGEHVAQFAQAQRQLQDILNVAGSPSPPVE